MTNHHRRAEYLIQSKMQLIRLLRERQCHIKYVVLRTKSDLVDILDKLDSGTTVDTIQEEYRISGR